MTFISTVRRALSSDCGKQDLLRAASLEAGTLLTSPLHLNSTVLATHTNPKVELSESCAAIPITESAEDNRPRNKLAIAPAGPMPIDGIL
jgi:hypothetical protein